ncbi:hypothetical protein E2C01_036178 [Portunus trituberculatus]|uniref:Uncharacterized protein n=1 Tax=Portunus trituberculatus TaxID=210409 RepID=A0A5B7FAM5_PORTR|nr:hypothetical protein [Portunus trituberculatus]
MFMIAMNNAAQKMGGFTSPAEPECAPERDSRRKLKIGKYINVRAGRRLAASSAANPKARHWHTNTISITATATTNTAIIIIST